MSQERQYGVARQGSGEGNDGQSGGCGGPWVSTLTVTQSWERVLEGTLASHPRAWHWAYWWALHEPQAWLCIEWPRSVRQLCLHHLQCASPLLTLQAWCAKCFAGTTRDGSLPRDMSMQIHQTYTCTDVGWHKSTLEESRNVGVGKSRCVKVEAPKTISTKIIIPLTSFPLRARHRARNFSWPHKGPLRWMFSSLFYGWENWGSKRGTLAVSRPRRW